MADIPETRYARNGPVSIAYQVVSDGPIDVVYAPAGVSHLDYGWRYPPAANLFARFARFSRFVMYDRRGTGLSDRTASPPSVEEHVSDLLAVLDAVGIGRAHLFGDADGAAAALALAASRPERVARVAAYAAFARFTQAEDYPYGPDPDYWEEAKRLLVEDWGGRAFIATIAPNYLHDREFTDWARALLRAAVSPAGAATMFQHFGEFDLRPILGDVEAPVLVVNLDQDSSIDPRHGRYLAAHLPDAHHVEVPGVDNLFLVDPDACEAVLDEVEEFFTGERPGRSTTRALTTVMFTDIVGSTERAADLGDTAWRRLLQRHDDLTRLTFEDHRGRVVEYTGDGALATFHDPADAIAAARSLIARLDQEGLSIRVGLHTGQIEIVGDGVAGLAVHLAARISALAGAGDIYVSRTVRDLVIGSDLTFEDRGTHDLKGIPGDWEILAVVDA